MKINHEETKSAKKDHTNFRALRFFVVDFPREFLKRRFLSKEI